MTVNMVDLVLLVVPEDGRVAAGVERRLVWVVARVPAVVVSWVLAKTRGHSIFK